jgi:hypothetical protein
MEKITYLNIWKDKIIIYEPTIKTLFDIEYLLWSDNNQKDNIKIVYNLLWIPEKYLIFANSLINKVLSSFWKEEKKAWWKSFFKWDLWLLAHHNFLSYKEFIEKHTISEIKELSNIREYYFNLINWEKEKNSKFIFAESWRDSEADELITQITGLKYNEKTNERN